MGWAKAPGSTAGPGSGAWAPRILRVSPGNQGRRRQEAGRMSGTRKQKFTHSREKWIWFQGTWCTLSLLFDICVPFKETTLSLSLHKLPLLGLPAFSAGLECTFPSVWAGFPVSAGFSSPLSWLHLAYHKDNEKASLRMRRAGSHIYTEILFCFTLLKMSSPIYLSIYFSGYSSNLKIC